MQAQSSFRKRSKVTRDVKMEFVVTLEAVIGLDAHAKHYIKLDRGSKIHETTGIFEPVSDIQRVQDYRDDAVVSGIQPTMANLGQSFTFHSTMQRKSDFDYKPKKMKVEVMDANYETSIITAEINLAKWVDAEMLVSRQIEISNRKEDKILYFWVEGMSLDRLRDKKKKAEKKEHKPEEEEPLPPAEDERSHAKRDEQMKDEREQLEGTKREEDARREDEEPPHQDHEEDDEDDELAAIIDNRSPKSDASPKAEQGSPRQETTKDTKGTTKTLSSSQRTGNAADTREEEPAATNTQVAAAEDKNTSSSAAATREAEPASAAEEEKEWEREEEQPKGYESEGSDEDNIPFVVPTATPVRTREAHAATEMDRKLHTVITKKGSTREPHPPTPAPSPKQMEPSPREEDDQPDETQPQQRHVESDDEGDIKNLKLEQHTAEDVAVQRQAPGPVTQQQTTTSTTTASPSRKERGSLKPKDCLVPTSVDAVTYAVNARLRQIRGSCLQPVYQRPQSKRMSLSRAEREVSLPIATEIILDALHTCRIPNGELSLFSSELLNGVLFSDVLHHTRHYGVWVRILLHVIDELILYYYPPAEELQGANWAALEEEQQFFQSTLGEIVREKDKMFSEEQQLNGDHVDYIMEQALHRGIPAPGMRPHPMWETEESDEDREDRMFLHALVVIESATVLQRLVSIASNRVDAVLRMPNAEGKIQFTKKDTFSSYGAAADDASAFCPATSSRFLFTVSRQNSTWLSATDGKRQLFSTQLGSTGWLPTLLNELSVLYQSLADPQPTLEGSTTTLLRSQTMSSKHVSPRTQALLAEVFKAVFFNINTVLLNHMHIRRATDDSRDDNEASKKRKAAAAAKSGNEPVEQMQIRTAKDALALKIALSALEQFMDEHQLVKECKKELLQLRQVCDLFILPKSIFADTKTRMEVCGLVPDEFMFHALYQFQLDEKDVMPDEVPVSLLDQLASSLALRHGVRANDEKGKTKQPTLLRDEVSSRVKIPISELLPLDFALTHIDNIRQKYSDAAKGIQHEERLQESRAIQDSMEWDTVNA